MSYYREFWAKNEVVHKSTLRTYKNNIRRCRDQAQLFLDNKTNDNKNLCRQNCCSTIKCSAEKKCNRETHRSALTQQILWTIGSIPERYRPSNWTSEYDKWEKMAGGDEKIKEAVALLYVYDQTLDVHYGPGWFDRLKLYAVEFFAFSYVEVIDDDINHTAHAFEVPCRSVTQWLIMLISELLALVTAGAVVVVLLAPVLFAFGWARHYVEFLVGSDQEIRKMTFLIVAKCLANIGVVTLAANAALEIGLLIDEPGLRHVRRVLALSFSGMALYLIKEYPDRHNDIEFLLGCLAAVIAAALWKLRSNNHSAPEKASVKVT